MASPYVDLAAARAAKIGAAKVLNGGTYDPEPVVPFVMPRDDEEPEDEPAPGRWPNWFSLLVTVAIEAGLIAFAGVVWWLS